MPGVSRRDFSSYLAALALRPRKLGTAGACRRNRCAERTGPTDSRPEFHARFATTAIIARYALARVARRARSEGTAGSVDGPRACRKEDLKRCLHVRPRWARRPVSAIPATMRCMKKPQMQAGAKPCSGCARRGTYGCRLPEDLAVRQRARKMTPKRPMPEMTWSAQRWPRHQPGFTRGPRSGRTAGPPLESPPRPTW